MRRAHSLILGLLVAASFYRPPGGIEHFQGYDQAVLGAILLLMGTLGLIVTTTAIITGKIQDRAQSPPEDSDSAAEDNDSGVEDSPEDLVTLRDMKRHILGIKDAALRVAGGDGLVTTTFDTSSRADAARILIQNTSGAEVTIENCQIVGKLVYEVPAWLHDDLEDVADQQRNGLKKWDLGNSMVVSGDQAQKLADYWWKHFAIKKHYWTVTAPGYWLWLEPGEWYTLQVGGPGKSEYIDALCELTVARVNANAGELGSTGLVFREVEQNWTLSINAVVRYLASGKGHLANYQNKAVVQSATAPGTGDFWCDGVNDQVEIQEAVDYVAELGGGEVFLSEGVFVIESPVALKDFVVLRGHGPGSVLQPDTDTDAISVTGTSGNEIFGAGIRDLRIKRAAVLSGGSDSIEDVDLSYADRFFAHAVEFDADAVIASPDPKVHTVIRARHCDDLLVMACDMRMAGTGVDVEECTGQVAWNTISMSAAADKAKTEGISVGDSPRFVVAENTISNLINSRPGRIGLVGISVFDSKNASIANNTVENIRAVAQTDPLSVCGAIRTSGARDGSTAEISGNAIRDVHNWHVGASLAPAVLVSANTDDSNIASNHIEHADIGVKIAASSCERTNLSGNFVLNCGQLIDYGNCEGGDEPMMRGETSPVTTNATWARSSDQAYEGSYSYKLLKTSAAGAGDCEAYVVDNNSSTAMHGLLAGVEYTYECWVYVPSVNGPTSLSEVEIRAYYYDSSSGQWKHSAVSPTGYNAWEKLTLTQAISSDATGSRGIRFALTSPAGANEYVYFDNVRIYPTKSQNAHDNLLKDEGTDTRF